MGKKVTRAQVRVQQRKGNITPKQAKQLMHEIQVAEDMENGLVILEQQRLARMAARRGATKSS
jgi:hypothetical protein